jgi:hypothetical protein
MLFFHEVMGGGPRRISKLSPSLCISFKVSSDIIDPIEGTQLFEINLGEHLQSILVDSKCIVRASNKLIRC